MPAKHLPGKTSSSQSFVPCLNLLVKKQTWSNWDNPILDGLFARPRSSQIIVSTAEKPVLFTFRDRTETVSILHGKLFDVTGFLVDILPDLDCFVFRVSGAIVFMLSCLFSATTVSNRRARGDAEPVDVNRRCTEKDWTSLSPHSSREVFFQEIFDVSCRC